jgi:hypothetical protein
MREFMSQLSTALIVTLVFMASFLFGFGVASSRPVAEPTSVTYASPEEDSATVDYRGDLNRWTVNGRIVPLDCPSEDSCSADYHDAAWHFSHDAH